MIQIDEFIDDVINTVLVVADNVVEHVIDDYNLPKRHAICL